jgi:4-hydroxybenzoate polyprenyltransferase
MIPMGTSSPASGTAHAEASLAEKLDAYRTPAEIPLCVDLDGTLVKSDTLLDAVVVMARKRPACLLKLPAWVMEGKAAFKRHVTTAVQLDVAHLPYNQPLLGYLEQERAKGRPIYLATGADYALAERVAEHVGLFTGVLGSDGTTNLTGKNKLAAFRERFGDQFSYIGNARPDVSLLTHCEEPMVANPDRSLSNALRSAGIVPVARFEDRASSLKAWLKAIRLHQWAKNTLIFVPLLLAHEHSAALMAAAVLSFLSFGLCASATYIVNDLLDLETDRRHLSKRRRPFAAGDLSPLAGAGVICLFMACSLVLALALPKVVAAMSPAEALVRPYYFLEWLGVYLVTTLAYSLYLKRVVLVDVIVLSGLYTVRILAGSAATGVFVSTWLAAFSIFFFLSLAFVKRFAELEGLLRRNAVPSNGRGYRTEDLEQLRSFGTASGYASVVVLTLYISNLAESAGQLYQHSTRLWLMVPILLLWISRLWLTASRGALHEDPVVYAITDRRSLMLGLCVLAVVVSAL